MEEYINIEIKAKFFFLVGGGTLLVGFGVPYYSHMRGLSTVSRYSRPGVLNCMSNALGVSSLNPTL